MLKRWLIIQSAGQHNGSDGWTPNDYLRECFGIQHGLLQNGCECDVWGKRHPNFEQTPDFNSYDAIILLENYEWEWVPDLSQITNPVKFHWIIDLHCQNPYVKWSQQCDVVLHSTKALIERYKSQCPNQRHVWFPNAVDDRYFTKRIMPKTRNICFVGNPHNRISFVQRLKIPHLFKTGVDMLDTIASSKIHFNKSISVDVNYRCFETIGLGTCLLTNRLKELEELGFVDGINCLFYEDEESCRCKILDNLASGKWQQIGENGYGFSQTHTYTERVKSILNTVK